MLDTCLHIRDLISLGQDKRLLSLKPLATNTLSSSLFSPDLAPMSLNADLFPRLQVDSVLLTDPRGKTLKGKGAMFLTITHLIFADSVNNIEIMVRNRITAE